MGCADPKMTLGPIAVPVRVDGTQKKRVLFNMLDFSRPDSLLLTARLPLAHPTPPPIRAEDALIIIIIIKHLLNHVIHNSKRE